MNKIKQQIQEVLDSDTTNLKMELPIALGKSEDGTICFRDLTSLKKLLIAGAIGQGKTSCLNGIIISLILDREGAEELDSVGKLIFSHYDEFLPLQGIQIGE